MTYLKILKVGRVINLSYDAIEITKNAQALFDKVTALNVTNENKDKVRGLFFPL